MYFRFGSAIVLVVLIGLWGTSLEKESLELRRRVSRQQFQRDALEDAHARLRLRAQEYGAPPRVIAALEAGGLKPQPATEVADERPPSRIPLLRWQQPAPSGETP